MLGKRVTVVGRWRALVPWCTCRVRWETWRRWGGARIPWGCSRNTRSPPTPRLQNTTDISERVMHVIAVHLTLQLHTMEQVTSKRSTALFVNGSACYASKHAIASGKYAELIVTSSRRSIAPVATNTVRLIRINIQQDNWCALCTKARHMLELWNKLFIKWSIFVETRQVSLGLSYLDFLSAALVPSTDCVTSVHAGDVWLLWRHTLPSLTNDPDIIPQLC